MTRAACSKHSQLNAANSSEMSRRRLGVDFITILYESALFGMHNARSVQQKIIMFNFHALCRTVSHIQVITTFYIYITTDLPNRSLTTVAMYALLVLISTRAEVQMTLSVKVLVTS
jgi:hypothetical protein